MKKLLLFITILAIGLYYINEKRHWITTRTYELKDVSKSATILLHKMKTQGNVYGYHVHITGHIEGKSKIKLYQSSGKGHLYKSENISGEVDIKWGGDWYADVLKIEYEPMVDVKNGTLFFEYAFDSFSRTKPI